MGIRDTLKSLVTEPAAAVMEDSVREMIEESLSSRSFVRAGELREIWQKIEELDLKAKEKPASPEVPPEIAAKLAEQAQEIAALQKKLNMAMGAIQAVTAQLADTRRGVDEAKGSAAHAEQKATTAQATAESVAEGISGVEDSLASVVSSLKSVTATVEAAGARSKSTPVDALASLEEEDETLSDDGIAGCKVPGCTRKLHGRGFCSRHYGMWRRGTLDGFVRPKGIVRIGERTWQVNLELISQPVMLVGDKVVVSGEAVDAEET